MKVGRVGLLMAAGVLVGITCFFLNILELGAVIYFLDVISRNRLQNELENNCKLVHKCGQDKEQRDGILGFRKMQLQDIR